MSSPTASSSVPANVSSLNDQVEESANNLLRGQQAPAPSPANRTTSPTTVMLSRPDSARWVAQQPRLLTPPQSEPGKAVAADEGACCPCRSSGISESLCSTYWLSAEWRNCLQDVLDQQWMVIGTSCATLMSLLAPDIAQLAFDRRSDIFVNSALFVCVTVFAVEIVLASLARKGYFLSFFWGLDLVATVSIAIAIPYEDMFEADDGTGAGCGAESVVESNDFVTQAGRTLRLVRQGGRALRVVRALRLVALVKAFGVVTQCCRTDSQKEREQKLQESMGDELAADKSTQATRIGRHLAFLSSVRVVYIILLLSITLPFAVSDRASVRAKESIASLLGVASTQPAATIDSVGRAVDTVDSVEGIDFLRVKLNGTLFREESLANVRCSDLVRIDIQQLQELPGSTAPLSGLTTSDEIVFDAKAESDARSVFNLVYVSVVLVVLVLSIVLSDRETRYFVVKPLMRITRILASLRQKLAQSFIDLDEADWETEVVEKYVLGMANWVEHQQRRGLLPTAEEEAAEHRAQRRQEEAAASTGSIAARGRLLLTRTASGILQLLDWGGNGQQQPGRRHTLGGASSRALASDLLTSQPWVDRHKHDGRLLKGNGTGGAAHGLARRQTMLSLRPGGGAIDDSTMAGGRSARMRRMQSALPGIREDSSDGKPLWRNQSMRFYGGGSALPDNARARAGSDSVLHAGMQARAQYSSGSSPVEAPSGLQKGGGSFVDHARDDEMGGIATPQISAGLAGRGRFVRRPHPDTQTVGSVQMYELPESQGEFPHRARRSYSEAQSTSTGTGKDDESVVQLWHHEDADANQTGNDTMSADLAGDIGHWDSSASAGRSRRGVVPSARPSPPPFPPRKLLPKQPFAGAAYNSDEADLASAGSTGVPPTLAAKGRSRSDSGQNPATLTALPPMPPVVSRRDTAPAHRGHGSGDASASSRPMSGQDDSAESPVSGQSGLPSSLMAADTRAGFDLGLSPDFLPMRSPRRGSMSAFALGGATDGAVGQNGTEIADPGQPVVPKPGATASNLVPNPYAVRSADQRKTSEDRPHTPEDSTAMSPLRSRRFSSMHLMTGITESVDGNGESSEASANIEQSTSSTHEREVQSGEDVVSVNVKVEELGSAAGTDSMTDQSTAHSSNIGASASPVRSAGPRRLMPRVMSSKDLDAAAMEVLGFQRAQGLGGRGSMIISRIGLSGRALTPVQEEAVLVFPDSDMPPVPAVVVDVNAVQGVGEVIPARGTVGSSPVVMARIQGRTPRATRTRSMLAMRSPWELSDEQIIRETPAMAQEVARRQQQSRTDRETELASSMQGQRQSDDASGDASGSRGDVDNREVDGVRSYLANNGIIIVRDIASADAGSGGEPSIPVGRRPGRSASDPPVPQQTLRRQSSILLDRSEHIFDPSGPLGVLNFRGNPSLAGTGRGRAESGQKPEK